MTHVLYVGHDKLQPQQYCPGSTACLKLAKVISKDVLIVQDCGVLLEKDVTFPRWLKGTPTLVDRESSNVIVGSEAIEYLRQMKASTTQAAPRGAEGHSVQNAHTMPEAQRPTVAVERSAERPRDDFSAPAGSPSVEMETIEPTEASGGANTEEAFAPQVDPSQLIERDGKVTEDDLQKFMQQRNAGRAQTAPPPS